MVDLALIYISFSAAELRIWRKKGIVDISAAFHFLVVRLCAIGAGAPATILSRYAMGYPKNAFF